MSALLLMCLLAAPAPVAPTALEKASAELTILRQHLEAYLANKETLEQALARAEADMTAQIGNPYA